MIPQQMLPNTAQMDGSRNLQNIYNNSVYPSQQPYPYPNQMRTDNMGQMNLYVPSGKGMMVRDLLKNHQTDQTYSDVESRHSHDSIDKLANDVNKSLQNFEDESDEKEKNTVTIEKKVVSPPDTTDQNNEYMKLITEFLILLTVYVVMSQDNIINFVMKYTQQFNQSSDDPTMTDIVIYGTMIAVIFFAVRRIVFYNF